MEPSGPLLAQFPRLKCAFLSAPLQSLRYMLTLYQSNDEGLKAILGCIPFPSLIFPSTANGVLAGYSKNLHTTCAQHWHPSILASSCDSFNLSPAPSLPRPSLPYLPPSLRSSNTSSRLQLIQSYRIKRGPRSLKSSLNAIRRCNTLRRKFGVRRLKISLRDDAV